MSETDAQSATEDATPDGGAETGQDATTEDDAAPEKTYSQSEVDNRVGMALKAAQKRTDEKLEAQRKQDEQIALLADGEYKTLYESMRADFDALRADQGAKDYTIEANGVLVKMGLSNYAETLIPGTKDTDELIQRAEAFRAGIASAAEAEVAKRLDTGTHRVPTNAKPKDPVALDKMSTDEFLEFKRANNYI